MALKQPAPIAIRAGKAWIVAAIAGGLLATTGCNHRRSALRPVFSGSRVVASPCSSCGGSTPCSSCSGGASGGSTTVIDEPAPTIIRGGSASGGAPRGSVINSEPGGSIPSDVPSLDEPAPTSGRKVKPETPPDATIGGDPDLDVLPSAAPASRSKSLRVPYDLKSNAKTSPSLRGPDGSKPTSYKADGGIRSTSATTTSGSGSGVVRRTSSRENLKSFFGENGGDDLFFPNKADRPWKYVVLHHSATETGNYDAIDAEHRKVLGFDGCGYHFVIGNGTGSGDGQIEVAQRWVNQKHGVHCRNARKAEIDEYGIGICMIGDFDKAPPTPRQLAAARALVDYLSRKYEIADDHVETHAHLAATPTVCPGKHFPIDSILASPTPVTPTSDRRAVPTAWKVKTPSRQGGTPVY